MKFTRTIAAILILALASSSAMASACATSCAAADTMSGLLHTSASAKNTAAPSDHCHLGAHETNKQHQDKPGAEHKCTMAGCNFAQATPLKTDPASFIANFSSATLPQFNAFALSAELSPPIKPPA